MPGIRIGVDATSWVNRRGYGRFARNALTRLVALDAETTYVFVIDEQSARTAELPAGAERLTVALSRQPASAAAADSYRPPTDLIRLGAAVTRARFDAVLFPSVYTYFLSVRAPSVVGIHDLIADDFPELTLPSRRARTFWQMKQRLAIGLSRRLFTVSESARRRISARLGIAPAKLAVVPEAPDPAFTPRPAADIERETVAIGIAPGERYLLYAGGISPHKDVETLVGAFASLRRDGEDGLRLVLVGALEDEAYVSAAGPIRRRIAELGLGDAVVLPGFVSDDALACLYTGAAAVVSPSLAEGFGLPAVEAAACGAPVVLSDIPAHRETLGDDALFFPPGDADQLAEHLTHLLASDMLRRSLAERGHRRVARYSWDASAEALRSLLHEVVRG
jgi:glycosyltransferase involved in cell wall biosynthesis